MTALEEAAPAWRTSAVFEPSPTGKASATIAAACPDYQTSVYRPDRELGTMVDGARNEDLQSLTLESRSVDVVVTQDVLEHVFEPAQVFAEIARVLHPGGVHVFTVPFHRDLPTTRIRARLSADGRVEHDFPPMYHEDPFDDTGALVTIDWGTDLPTLVDAWADTETELLRVAPGHADEEAVDVFVSRRTSVNLS